MVKSFVLLTRNVTRNLSSWSPASPDERVTLLRAILTFSRSIGVETIRG